MRYRNRLLAVIERWNRLIGLGLNACILAFMLGKRRMAYFDVLGQRDFHLLLYLILLSIRLGSVKHLSFSRFIVDHVFLR